MKKTKMMRLAAMVLTTVMLSTVFTGCTSENSGNSTTAPAESGVADGTEASEKTADSTAAPEVKTGTIKVGVSTNALSNIHNRHMFESVTEAVKAAGHEAVAVNANGDAAQQAIDIENLVQAGCDVIVVQNGDSFSLQNAVKEAAADGVKVISQDSGWMEGCSILFTLNSFKVGADIYMLLAAETSFSGKIITTGHQDNFALRSIGALQQAFLNEYSNLEEVAHVQTTFPGTTEVTYNGLESALIANPDVAAIWTSQDLEAMGAIQALKEAGLYPQVKCVGVDGELDVLKDIAAGGSALCTAVSDLDGCAASIVEYSERLCAGDDTCPKFVDIPYTIVTKENAEEFIAKAEAEQSKYAD